MWPCISLNRYTLVDKFEKRNKNEAKYSINCMCGRWCNLDEDDVGMSILSFCPFFYNENCMDVESHGIELEKRM